MNFAIIPSSEIDSVDFAQVQETDATQCLTSPNGAYKLVTFEGTVPSSVAALKYEGGFAFADAAEVITNIQEWGVE